MKLSLSHLIGGKMAKSQQIVTIYPDCSVSRYSIWWYSRRAKGGHFDRRASRFDHRMTNGSCTANYPVRSPFIGSLFILVDYCSTTFP